MKAKRKKVSIICCIGKNLSIGKDNKLLWNIPEDLQHFRKITAGHVVIMGSRTFESMGKPLPKRTNIVVANDVNYNCEGCLMARSLEEAFEIAQKHEKEEIFVIGGGSIYKQTIGMADKLYLTIVDDSPEADIYFPDYSDFKRIISKQENNDGNYRFTYLELER